MKNDNVTKDDTAVKKDQSTAKVSVNRKRQRTRRSNSTRRPGAQAKEDVNSREKVTKEIIVNSNGRETRIAIAENARLVEIFVENFGNERTLGNIYKARVAKIFPSLKGAFVDIGMSKNAFLHFSDVKDRIVNYHNGSSDGPTVYRPKEGQRFPYLSDSLKIGQEILVQVIREPIYDKGARVTSDISLPGRFTVLIPCDGDQIGVSRKIKDIRERRRLKQLARDVKPEGYGIIVRTEAAGKDDDVLKSDIKRLLNSWSDIDRSSKSTRAPVNVYKDLEIASTVVRDLFTDDVSRVLIDNQKVYKQIRNYVQFVSPALVSRIEQYKGKKPIFDIHNIEQELHHCLNARVAIPNGSSLIIEPTEALTTIDVNSGKVIGRSDYEATATKVNVEAAREAARQLRLRDIGGLIVIDFIDMYDQKNKKKVYDELIKEFKKDRAVTSVAKISQFGLVEMTRERLRPTLIFSFKESCPVCNGTGLVLTKDSVISKLDRWIKRFKASNRGFQHLKIIAHPEIAGHLPKDYKNRFKQLFRNRLLLTIEEDSNVNIDDFKIYLKKNNSDITSKYSIE